MKNKGSKIGFGILALILLNVGIPFAAPGLYYGTVSGNINTTSPNPNTSTTTTLSETENSIGGNTTEIYTGAIYDADGNISFTEDMDDKTRLYIDGNQVLSSDSWSNRVSTGNLNLTPGWHAFELRISNGSGGSGPNTSPGFGFDPNGGTNWVHPSDPGDGSLFQTEVPSGGGGEYLPLAGGTMSGILNMGGSNITDVYEINFSSLGRITGVNDLLGKFGYFEQVQVTGGDLTITDGELIVTSSSSAPDYVFSTDYKLLPLQEVEGFITKNKHLPGIPSGRDLESKGINVAEMNYKLLEKIEELTLHVIRQEKEINSLKGKLK